MSSCSHRAMCVAHSAKPALPTTHSLSACRCHWLLTLTTQREGAGHGAPALRASLSAAAGQPSQLATSVWEHPAGQPPDGPETTAAQYCFGACLWADLRQPRPPAHLRGRTSRQLPAWRRHRHAAAERGLSPAGTGPQTPGTDASASCPEAGPAATRQRLNSPACSVAGRWTGKPQAVRT